MDKQIIYTKTDEAPALATYSWLPIVRNYLKKADISVGSKDISLAARILAQFPDYLNEDQQVDDDLQILGDMTADEMLISLSFLISVHLFHNLPQQ